MKILRLLNKKYFSILLILLIGVEANSEEQPADIWNIDKNKIEQKSSIEQLEKDKNLEIKTYPESNIYNMQSNNENNIIELDETLDVNNFKIYGLYDPEDYGLNINMWSNSDGDQIKKLLSKLIKMNLSNDANEIMNIALLTNAYLPEKNISEKEFLKLKSDWLIKNSDLELIEEYLITNQILDIHPKLTKYLVDQYLAEANIKKACKILSKNSKPVNDKYLSKFNIYCLIVSGKNEEAQLYFDLKKELGFKDEYFEEKIKYLFGYDIKDEKLISEETILDFHLAHKTIINFNFDPKENTSKLIWKYLASSNLLNSFKKIEISELDKISILEKATHNKNYPEKDLFKIYKQFQFSINQLLEVNKSYKSLSNIEARALVYQKILLESETKEKLKFLKILKNLFESEKIGNAFDLELKKFLEKIKPTDVPDNLTSFYYTNIKIKKDKDDKIKFNNEILHQSKLINYFNGDYSKSKIEKEVSNFLKKIRKNKKYFFSKKDQIFLESLKFDGIEISEKYDDLYKVNEAEIPTDIQVMINNDEKGSALLRIVEVIGQDKIERIDDDTIYFIIRTLNQLDISPLRNKILLKVLPLKV